MNEAALHASLVADRYRLGERLPSRGGSPAVVYEAVHLLRRKTFALKFVSKAYWWSDVPARLRNDREALRGLSHPGLLANLELEDLGHEYWVLVMEFGQGPVLADAPLSADDGLAIFPPICDAVAALHRRGVVHGYIRPASIFLGGDTPRLGDQGFGVDPCPPNVQRLGVRLSPARYLSPELLVGGQATPQSDVWALGVLLAELLGARPFSDRDLPAMRQIFSGGHSLELAGLAAHHASLIRACLGPHESRPRDAVELCARFHERV
ncbi:MAG: protein kinase [Myxococcota bacterium]